MSNACLSNRLCVDCVVLFVGANKPDVDNPIWVIDPNDDTILVTADIENGYRRRENVVARVGSAGC